MNAQLEPAFHHYQAWLKCKMLELAKRFEESPSPEFQAKLLGVAEAADWALMFTREVTGQLPSSDDCLDVSIQPPEEKGT